ncbi:hypothetical protein [Metabacillus halosaccharovorans]|uniref:hypothetical protein n=1 Tax=Metabacillus halosaccharovorans TaxID=930124 RepID=UPI00111784E9|nr:hypothetical protein [Metabacillus halosaccharovorans]
MGDSVGRTAKGVYHTAKNTYHSGKSTYEGFRDGDDTKIKQGLRDIGKTVAIGTLAVGVIDLVDGVDGGDPSTNNQNMAEGGTEGTSNVIRFNHMWHKQMWQLLMIRQNNQEHIM